MSQRDPKQRFSSRVEEYIRFRPGYPPAVMDCLRHEFGLTPAHRVADVGSGTGISTEMFLRNGNAVVGVEPNDAMRAAAERLLAAYPRFESCAGSAEALPLPDASVDWIVAAQAFHWFDVSAARAEFRRVLRPGGRAALLWNNRREDTPFLAAYEQLLREFSIDYLAIRHQNAEADGRVAAFFGTPGNLGDRPLAGWLRGRRPGLEETGQRPVRHVGATADAALALRRFPNRQPCDYPGLEGRTMSASYVPGRDDPRHADMLAALRALFDRLAENGGVTLEYDTHLYVGRL